MAKYDNYTNALLEKILGEVQAVHEIVADHPTRREFSELREDVSELQADVKTIKAAVTDQSKQTDQRIEQKIAEHVKAVHRRTVTT